MPLINSFNETLRNMLHMLYRVAVWTEHFQVFDRIVVSVPVFVMYAKNRRIFTIPAPLAAIEKASAPHVLSNRGESRFPFGMMLFADACPATIFPFMRGCPEELFSAMAACVRYGSLEVLGAMVALSRAVFCSISTRTYVGKFRSTDSAISRVLRSLRQRQASARTIFGDRFLIRLDRVFCVAVLAVQKDGHSYAFN
jgi:hypothetical protein